MGNEGVDSISILYVDTEISFHDLVSVALPKYGEFTVFTASSTASTEDILTDEQIDGIVVAEPVPDRFEQALRNALSEQEDRSPLRITTGPNGAETDTVPVSHDDHDGPEGLIEQFENLIERVEVLTGKHCIGYQLQARPYQISNNISRSEGYQKTTKSNIVQSDTRSTHQDSVDQPLITLHEATTKLLQAETRDEILTIVLDATDNILQLPAAAIYLWDDQEGVLRPHEATDDTTALFGELPTFTGPDSLAWDAFIDGEFRVYDEVTQHQRRYNPETVIEAELFAPLGEHGLLLSGATEPDEFTTENIRATQTLAANTVTALNLVDQKQQLTDKRQQLQRQSKQLTTLKRINSVVRETGQATVTSSTRSEIENTICEKLTSIDPYVFAWIGQHDHDDTLHAREWSGQNGEFLDYLCGDAGTSTEQIPPAEQAISTGNVQVAQNIFSDESFAPWRKAALDRGFQSALSLPLSYNQTTYGVLEIYASQAHAFGAEEQDAFSELGDMIANAFSAIERKQALISNTQSELELRMHGEDDVFSQTAQEANINLELDTVVSRDDGTWLVYVTTSEVDSSTVLSIIRGVTVVESVQQIRGPEDGNLFGVVLTEFELGELLATHGATLNTIQASRDETTVEVSVPEEVDVRSVVAACQNRYASIELVRRNSNVDTSRLDAAQQGAVLTDKQREALEKALNHGFFSWPRDKTGEEIAESLGVTPPTFHRHVRLGLEALVQERIGQ